MKYIICLLFSTVLLSCTSSLDTKEYTQSPCIDISYQKLSKMKTSDMTSSQLEYFKMKDKECQDFKAEHKKSIHNIYNDKQADKNAIWWVLGGISVIIILGVIIVSGLSGWH